MKLSIDWLNDFVSLEQVTTEELVHRLTMSTCEVEDVIQAFSHLTIVRVARVEKVERHPNADRLSVCTVNAGQKSPLSIVCGAPNVQAGMLVPLAPIGARLPRENDVLEIKPTTIRGVESQGMLCSAAELGTEEITGAVDGLLDLAGLGPAKPGQALNELLPLNDTILEIDNKSITHRPDLWCHLGFAREIAAIFGRPLSFDPLAKTEAAATARLSRPAQKLKTPPKNPKLAAKKIEIEDGAADAYYGACLAGVHIGPSPLWVQARLLNVGQRPINNVVDASNYLMFEIGQPNHTFDLEVLSKDTISVCKNQGPHRLKRYTTLDGVDRELPEAAILIRDGDRSGPVLALGGVMGGQSSGVRESTTGLFLESATFAREHIRRTLSATGLRTDSAIRFEKGQDPAKAKPALERLAALIRESCPETRLGKVTGSSPRGPKKNAISVSLAFLRSRLGFEIGAAEVSDILGRLNFEVARSGSGDAVVFKLRAPTFRSRHDVSIPEDIVEELGRMYGYDNIEPRAPLVAADSIPINRETDLRNRLKRSLASAGFTETYGYSFVPEADNELAGVAGVALKNPVFQDRPQMRGALLPGLLRQAALNQDRFDIVSLFELGRTYHVGRAYAKGLTTTLMQSLETPVLEENHLAIATLQPRIHAVSKDASLLDLFLDFRARLEQILVPLLGPFEWKRPPKQSVFFHPGCHLELLAPDGVLLGAIGLAHPLALKHVELKRDCLLADLHFEACFTAAEKHRRSSDYQPPSIFPDSYFELSLLLSDDAGTEGPVQIAHGLKIEELRRMELLTIYAGDPIPPGKKSVSYRVTCGSEKGTLGSEQTQRIMERVVKALGDAGYPLRA
ncbi:MAG: phenylalanine--tRNA ligase subunit beta [Leptospiraceae bacterium]|nr:phenylalanine--tRNA ligase subunit beta [Leptospiraceae bacterium]